MKVVNLYGGAGAGKSTIAAALFSRLRLDNEFNVELVPEFAKDVVYEDAHRNLSDQFYLLGNQQHRLWRLKQSGIELAICDSPIEMSIAYSKLRKFPHLPELIVLVKYMLSQYTNYNVFVHRQVEGNFRKNKRWSTDIDREIKNNIDIDLNVEYNSVGSDVLYEATKKWAGSSIGRAAPLQGEG